MSATNRVLKNTFFLYVRMIVSIVVNILATKVLLQALGVSDFGLYNVVASVLSMLGFLNASMSTTTQRFLSVSEGEGKKDKIKSIFSTSVYLHWIIAGITFSFFLIIGFFLFDGLLVYPTEREVAALTIYFVMMVSTLFSITTVPYEAVLNAHENMFYYSILGIVDVVLKLIIAFSLLYCSLDRLICYGVLLAFETWLVRFITIQYCKHHYWECSNNDLRQYFSREIMKDMARFAGWNTANISTGMFSLYGMNLIINHFFGTIVNASLAIANQLSGVMLGVSSNMVKALTPVMMKKEGENNREKVIELSYLGSKYSYLLYAVICIPVFIDLPFVLRLWLGIVPEWSVLFCRLLIISTLVDQLFVFLYNSIQAEGEVKVYSIWRSIFNICPIFITVMLFHFGCKPYWGILTWIFFKALIGGCLNLYFCKKNLGLLVSRWLKQVLFPATLISLSSVFVCITLLKTVGNISSVVGEISLFCSMFVLSLPFYWVFGLNAIERMMIKTMVYQVHVTRFKNSGKY